MRSPCARQRQGHDHPHYRVMTKAKPLPPFELINELLRYEQKTGHLFWKKKSGRSAEGQMAGWQTLPPKSKTPYLKVQINKQVFYCHRIAYYLHTQVDPSDRQIDHIDGNGLNNAWANLRLASPVQNRANVGPTLKNTSGYKGVYYNRKNKKWYALFIHEGNRRYIGLFGTPELAYMAYCKAAAELHGEFARGA